MSDTSPWITTDEPCPSGDTDCTVDCGSCKGTGRKVTGRSSSTSTRSEMNGCCQVPCACGQLRVAADGSHRTEINGVSHGLTPCFVCDTYGVSFYEPLTPDAERVLPPAIPDAVIGLIATCCGRDADDPRPHGLGLCWGPRWIGRLRRATVELGVAPRGRAS